MPPFNPKPTKKTKVTQPTSAKKSVKKPVITRKPVTTRKLPVVVSTMRRACDLNHRQVAFVVEYLKDYDLIGAYERAGYTNCADENKRISARRLLRDPRVLQMINAEQLKVMNATGIDRENTVQRIHLQYLEARRDRDHGVALKALVEIGKVLGIYETHNKQKINYTQSDVERLKKELAESGFDLDRMEPSVN